MSNPDSSKQPATVASVGSSVALAAFSSAVGNSLLKFKETDGSSSNPGKEPLSVASTTINFRRFVIKSGPIFAVQDAVESLIKWEDAPTSLFACVAWLLVCLYPRLLLVLPNLLLATVLLATYSDRDRIRLVSKKAQSGDDDLLARGEDAPGPPEESVNYLSNLQNIQIMMGRVADLTDLGRNIVTSLAWHKQSTIVILQVNVVLGVAIFLIGPYMPWRHIAALVGPALICAGHPVFQSFLTELSPHLEHSGREYVCPGRQIMRDDSLSDDMLYSH